MAKLCRAAKKDEPPDGGKNEGMYMNLKSTSNHSLVSEYKAFLDDDVTAERPAGVTSARHPLPKAIAEPQTS